MTEMIRALVVDDERYAREEMIYLLEQFERVKIVGEADSGELAIIKAMQLQPDVVFLDIEMPKVDGMEVARTLGSLKKVPLVVFATAYPQFAAEAFRVHAIDYLLKPYDEEQLRQTIARVEQLLLQPKTDASPKRIDRLPVEMEGEIHYIPIGDILYVHREENWTKIVTPARDYETRMTLKELENRLTYSSFFRIHKSILVNLVHVSSLTPWFNGAYQLEVDQRPEKLSVSRNYVKELRQRLEG
ncbi:DNA-binding response regulator [Sporosarcina sp. P12(2017)]|uniref:LytR/AlgR family response regulator transcription factor n=1 Tax=unclassified Sporosarcina TaxID=2647733 RepID=UPI000C16433E|nr:MULTISPECIES: LytTR family DNA-binding domain-containing protein [unclassified Sporosarcina]PIC56847.1 DNA-binding response regulator [Sporosarcina sp. P10]PIC60242.1 DNA-binding response regulator [Sporosarcina sp. P12(2017)]